MHKKLLILIGLFSLFTNSAMYADTQTVSVTGSVAPHTTDIPITITNDTTGSTIPQNTIVTYTITYGSKLLYGDHMTIEADWYQGALTGSTNPSIDAMTYVIGSATNAYNGTTPVVDLNNQKITWYISSLPTNTLNQTVTFQLRTNTSYTGTATVKFPVKVYLSVTNYSKPYEESDITYQYNSSQATPTPTPKSTATPVPEKPSTTPTPTIIPTETEIPTIAPKQDAPAFNAVTFLNLNSSEIDIAYNAPQVGTVSFLWGDDPKDMQVSQTISAKGAGVVSHSNLVPQTTYYFQLKLSGNTANGASEIFSVTTPALSVAPEVNKTSLVILSGSQILYSPNQSNSDNPTDVLKKIPAIAIAPTTNYTITFKLTKTNIQSVQILAQSSNVLGIATPVFAQNNLATYPYIFTAVDQGNGVYAATIANTLSPGSYNLLTIVHDKEGNITTQQLADMHVLHPFQAFNKVTKQPIEDVRIVLYQFDPRSKSYQILITTSNETKNPIYTDKNGQVAQQLPVGQYKAIFGRVGYDLATVYFGVGMSPQDDLPAVAMHPVPITVGRIFTYYYSAFLDLYTLTAGYIEELHASYRFFDLIGLMVIFCFITLCFLLFLLKTRMTIKQIPFYLHHHGLKLFGQKETPYLSGKMINSNQIPLSGVDIFVMDSKTRQVIAQTTTNTAGGFLLRLDTKRQYSISALKQGYDPLDNISYTPNMLVTLKQAETFHLLRAPFPFIRNIIVMFFEFLLFLSFLLSLILFPAFGLARTVPLVFASFINLLLWYFYTREKRR